jgi:hypothetical protein
MRSKQGHIISVIFIASECPHLAPTLNKMNRILKTPELTHDMTHLASLEFYFVTNQNLHHHHSLYFERFHNNVTPQNMPITTIKT